MDQLELTKKEAVLLLNNPPTNFEARKYTRGIYSKLNEDARIPALTKSLESWTTGKELHAGRLQGDSSSKSLDFPDPLLCILFILRYAITDLQSLHNMKTLLSADFTPPISQYTVKQFYTPDWLRTHFINNVVDVVDVFMGKSTGPVQSSTLSAPPNTSARMRMALLHTTTKAIIQVLLKYGCNPKLPPTADFQNFIQYLKDRSASKNPTTAVEVILNALPLLVQSTVTNNLRTSIAGVPQKDHCLTMHWITDRIPPVTVDSFHIIICANVSNGILISERALRITEYFDKVFEGNILFSEIPKPPIQTSAEATSSSPKRKQTSGGGGGGGSSSLSSPKKKTKLEPQLDTTTIERNLKSIEEATVDLASQAKTSVTRAITEIRAILVQYNSSKQTDTNVAATTAPPDDTTTKTVDKSKK
jgi:hypothetical protein